MTATEQYEARFDELGRRVPDFFIAGQPKSGTTAVYEMLRGHPQIFMPAVKEPRFLAPDVCVVPPPGSGGQLPGSLGEYLALFAPAGAGQRVGEASPLYMFSAVAPGEIARLAPHARVVVIVRDPASLLLSLHAQLVQSHVEDCGDLLVALDLQDERRAGRKLPDAVEFRPALLMYTDHVRYVAQLERLAGAVGRERLMVVVYDDLRADNAGTVAAIASFLGADGGVPVEVQEANPTVRVRSLRLHRLVHDVSLGRGPASRAMKSTIKTLTPQRLRRRALDTAQHRIAVAAPTQPAAAVVAELRRRYRHEVAALGEYLGRDLVAEWGYDESA